MSRILTHLITLSLLASCHSSAGPANITEYSVHNAPATLLSVDAVVWAVNVGGDEYAGSDGVHYTPDESIENGSSGTIGNILGAQDGTVYQSYRMGQLKIQRPMANGRYDLTFQFAEPEDIASGERVFDVFVNDLKVISAMDIRRARDGNHSSALDRSVAGVEVINGQLDIKLLGGAAPPVLNGLIVRSQTPDTRKWVPLWSDEFDDDTLDAGKWGIEVWPPGKVNREDQAYTDRDKNVRIENGKLILEAHLEAYDGAAYTSGRIDARGKGDFLYGRVDIRARIPTGQGTWSALWMLPKDPFRYASTCDPGDDWQDWSCDAWPNSGEIDIMEHVGYDMGNVHGTVHNRAYYTKNSQQRKGSVEVPDIDKAFHIYSMDWDPEYIRIYVDGSLYFSYFRENAGWQAWPYDHPYHPILNLAIGGWWGRAGGPVDDRIFPVRMEIDYVRVFKAVDSTTTEKQL
jgi:beta-glucanase (GH16 family)